MDPRIERAAAGDREAAQAVLTELQPRVRNLVRYLIRGDRDVEDLTQHALIDILRGLPSYRGDAPLKRWADRVTVRSTLSRIKRRRAQDARQAELSTQLHAVPVMEDGTRYLARRELAQRLDALPEEQRQALVLHRLLEMTVPEVAEALQVPFDTAKSRIRLAMQKLRQAHAAQGEGQNA